MLRKFAITSVNKVAFHSCELTVLMPDLRKKYWENS